MNTKIERANRECDKCETEPARYWRSVTDADGALLTREALCRRCAGGFFAVGLADRRRKIAKEE